MAYTVLSTIATILDHGLRQMKKSFCGQLKLGSNIALGFKNEVYKNEDVYSHGNQYTVLRNVLLYLRSICNPIFINHNLRSFHDAAHILSSLSGEQNLSHGDKILNLTLTDKLDSEEKRLNINGLTCQSQYKASHDILMKFVTSAYEHTKYDYHKFTGKSPKTARKIAASSLYQF